MSHPLRTLILFLSLGGGLTEPENFWWLESCDLDCPGPCLRSAFGYTLSNGDEGFFEDLSCVIQRPGHQWTFDVIWSNEVFGCSSSYGFDAVVIRGSPSLDRFEAEIGAGISFIWVSSYPDFLVAQKYGISFGKISTYKNTR